MELEDIHVDQSETSVSTKDLNALIDPKSITHLKDTFTDFRGLVKALRSDIHNGITSASIPKRISMYGSNEMPPPKTHSFFRFVWNALKEKMVLFLLIAAVISVGAGLYQTFTGEPNGWLEGVIIVAAILLIVSVNSVNDFRKQARFKQLEDASAKLRHVKVVRDGETKQIPNAELVVGDILFVSMGDVLPCDGVLVEGKYIKTDESSLTGESDQIIKDDEDPFMLSGSTVVDGSGKMVVTAVGEQSMMGRMTLDLRVMPPPTDLQIRLTKVATSLSYGGFTLAVIVLAALLAIYFIKGSPGVLIDELTTIIFVGISIIVLGIPESLPMAIVLALSHSTINMLKENCLVRYLAASEIMGSVSVLCTDKTGTLTTNQMEVVNALVFGTDLDREHVNDMLTSGNEEQIQHLMNNIMLNSEAYETTTPDGNKVFIGSKTDVGLLLWAQKKGFDYKKARESANIIDIIPFSSERKRMTTTIQYDEDRSFTYTKGASEIVLGLCDRYISVDGSIIEIDDDYRQNISNKIAEYARESLRTIVCAYHHLNETDNQFILSGLFAIEDPLRGDSRQSVQECQDAGVVVIMVTGDNALTGSAIARQCGILTLPQHEVIEGPDFRKLSDDELNVLLPNLRVVARSSPGDKLLLVNALKKMGKIVAMSGDGYNDAPSLISSNVGFAMGSGSEGAKKAASIVILDDSFKSMVNAIKWGRTVYQCVQKFLMFQIPVNLAAVTIVVVTCLSSAISTGIPEPGLLTIPVLWINLVSDSMASLALSTDKPNKDVLRTHPRRNDENLITPFMWSMILTQGAYQTTLGLVIFYLGPLFWGYDYTLRTTMVFNVFLYAILFNELNCRSITSDINIFRGIWFTKNKFFIELLLFGLIVQYPVVTYLGVIFHTTPLTWWQWVLSIGLGLGSLVIGLVVRLVWKAHEKRVRKIV